MIPPDRNCCNRFLIGESAMLLPDPGDGVANVSPVSWPFFLQFEVTRKKRLAVPETVGDSLIEIPVQDLRPENGRETFIVPAAPGQTGMGFNMAQNKTVHIFTRYQVFIICILTFLQFTIILDFMVLSPLGAILLKELHITTSQFGFVVSVYAFSAGVSGLLAAGFADKFDRKRFLLFFYVGFLIGTFLCSRAPDYRFLLIARVITGFFGGVINSIIYAIITDLFALTVRGRVMGFVQMAFASSQVLGIPMGLYLANRYGWHFSFGFIVLVGVVVGVAIHLYMRPISDHLKLEVKQSPFVHLKRTVSQSSYLQAFMATTLMATGGFMMMPFASAFSVNNMGVTLEELPLVYMITGFTSMFAGPLIGRISDEIGKYRVFVVGSLLSMIFVIIFSSRGLTPLFVVILLNVFLFVGISSRMISGMALMTAVPDPGDRGAFMSINASVQQISGGIGSTAAGLIVVQSVSGKIEHFNTLGLVVSVTMLITVGLMYFIHRIVAEKTGVPEAS